MYIHYTVLMDEVADRPQALATADIMGLQATQQVQTN